MAVAAAALTLGIGVADADSALAADSGGQRIVVTQRPNDTSLETIEASASGMLANDWIDESRLILVENGRILKVLTPDFHSAADPEVSLSGERLLFAGKKQAGDRWAIYEMSVAGSAARLIVGESDDLRQPFYLPTVYTLIADPTKGTEPREQIGFVRHFRKRLNEFGDAIASGLSSCRLDGSDQQRLTLNLSNEMDPIVLPDGRIVYAAWQRATLDRGYRGRVSLLSVNADGSDPMIYSADEGQRIKTMPSVTASGLVVFVEADLASWDGAGSLASVLLRRNLHSYRPITKNEDGLYHSPSPLPDGGILAARRPADGSGTHEIVRVDPRTGRFRPVFDDPRYHDIQPKLVTSRPAVDHRSSPIRDPDEGPTHDASPKVEGLMYGLNVYLNDLGVDLPAGAIQRLRVLEGLPTVEDAASLAWSPEPPVPGASRRGLPPLAQRRLLGEAPVEDDGSFYVLVPADIPIQLQILDADGMALRSSGWIWVHNRIKQGCIGCHEDAELTPQNRFVNAVKKPGVRLTLPPSRRRTVDFRRDIMPIIDSRCATCHGEGKQVRLDGGVDAPGASGVFNRAYETLVRGLAPRYDGWIAGAYVHPGRARTSPLVWHLFGRNTARPWDGDAAMHEAKPIPEDVELTAEERRLFVEWIDLGALWEGIPGAEAMGEAP
jgi:hypothetical protein